MKKLILIIVIVFSGMLAQAQKINFYKAEVYFENIKTNITKLDDVQYDDIRVYWYDETIAIWIDDNRSKFTVHNAIKENDGWVTWECTNDEGAPIEIAYKIGDNILYVEDIYPDQYGWYVSIELHCNHELRPY